MQAEASLVAGRGETVTWEMRERMPFSRSPFLDDSAVKDVEDDSILSVNLSHD